MKPLKVLQVFTILNRGGAETNLMNYYRHMDRSEVQFDFLVHRQEEGAYEQEILQLGGKIFRLPALHPLRVKQYKKAVKKFFDEHFGYDIIHGQCSELGIYIYKEAKKRKIPVIIAHAHNSKMDWDQKAPFRVVWKNGMRKSINAYFTCGHDAAKWLFGKKIAKKVYQMNNAISTQEFVYNPVVRQSVREALQAENSLNFIHVGRFNVQKNHQFLIQVFFEILKIRPQSKLFLVGEGELEGQISAQVNRLNLHEHVIFLGSRDDVPELLQGMDILLFPSLFEGLPVTLVEAQTSGLLCAISDGIPAEAVLVPENVKIYSLKSSAPFWAQQIIDESTRFQRQEVAQTVKDAGYDIADNAIKLGQKYIELYQQFS